MKIHRSPAYLAGYAHGLIPDTTCRDSPYERDTEEDQEWYAGWYIAYQERRGWWPKSVTDPQICWLVGRVEAHAARFYDRGWDVVHECMEIADIAAYLNPDMTVYDAIDAVAEGEYLEAYNDARNDALAAGGLPTTEYVKGI